MSNNIDIDIFPNPKKLRALDDKLMQIAQGYLSRIEQNCDQETFEILKKQKDFLYVLGMSDFIGKTICQYPKECAQIIAKGALEDATFALDLEQVVNEVLEFDLPEIELKKRLRILRRCYMVPIAWRDLTGRADIEEIFVSLSNLAECIVMRTVDIVRKSMFKTYGDVYDKEHRPMPLLILGMGKLGGGELNFSSDIDLIFCYPYDGISQGGSREISHQEFFSKIVQKMSNLLSDITADGFCYRIDLRLRPFGDAGAYVSSFDALSAYYETQGRTWERYALVKAKLLGDYKRWYSYGDELIELLRPFVYRRYLDFGAIESLRKLKRMIESELRRKMLDNNFKLGKGGIREVEFIAQVFELMRGGKIPELAQRSLRKTLMSLAKLGLLPFEVCLKLDDYYVFLRRLENMVQEIADEQTQVLPENDIDKLRVAYGMNKDNFEQLKEHVNKVCSDVHKEFLTVISDDNNNQEEVDLSFEIFDSQLDVHEIELSLEKYIQDKEKIPDYAKAFVSIRSTLSKLPVGPNGRQTLVYLMPRLIKLCAKHENGADILIKAGALIEKIALRTTYLQLLSENKNATERLVALLNENEFASALISANPVLLDELIAPQYFKEPPHTEQIMQWLQERLLRIEPNDLEAQMEELRLFKKVMVLRIAMSDMAQILPLMKISDSLTWLAEAIIKTISSLAWNQIVKRFGPPSGTSSDNPGFAIIGYGKLGGIELGYKSDLDMVFIRDNIESQTTGEHPISSAQFYIKLVQRLLHLTTTSMQGGILYDLDMRLRPDGDSGLLVTDLNGFEAYQRSRAWTWEHQALVRARAIAGSKNVIDKFNHIRDQILRLKRDDQKLKDDVYAMRLKMRKHLDKSNERIFDLKHGAGGMVDIEFIAQYLLLKYAPVYEDMILWSDNVRILDECARLKILSEQNVNDLKDAYIQLRGIFHRLSLTDQPRLIDHQQRPESCQKVESIWQELFSQVNSIELDNTRALLDN